MLNDDAKVIVGVSPSLAGLAALRFALEQARRRHVRLWAVRVWRLDVGPRARPSAEWERAIAAEARRCVQDAVREATGRDARDLEVVIRTPSGQVGAALHDFVTSPEDLLVLGAASHRFATGTVRRCFRGAPCPVVVVPPPDLARGGLVSGRRLAREAADELARAPRPGGW